MLSHIPRKNSIASFHFCLILSQALSTAFLSASHAIFANSVMESQFFITTIKAVITPITANIGAATAVIAGIIVPVITVPTPDNVGITVVPMNDTTEPILVIILPIPYVNFPTTNIIGPIAAAIAAALIIKFCICGSKFCHHCASPCNFSDNLITYGKSCSPIDIAAFCNEVLALSMAIEGSDSSSLSKAVSAVPVDVANAFTASSKSFVCCVMVAAALAACCEPNISASDTPVSSAASSTITNTSDRSYPSSISSLKDFPVFSSKISDAVDPVLPSSLSIPFMYVVASAVPIPFLVVVTYAADN